MPAGTQIIIREGLGTLPRVVELLGWVALVRDWSRVKSPIASFAGASLFQFSGSGALLVAAHAATLWLPPFVFTRPADATKSDRSAGRYRTVRPNLRNIGPDPCRRQRLSELRLTRRMLEASISFKSGAGVSVVTVDPFHSGLEGSRTDLGAPCYVRIIQICSPTPRSPYASGNNEELQDRSGRSRSAKH